MSDLADRAARATRMAQVIEAHVIVTTVCNPLTLAARAIESALGTNHDVARTVRALADAARVAAQKLTTVRNNTPWP
jgi:hypothetical protein